MTKTKLTDIDLKLIGNFVKTEITTALEPLKLSVQQLRQTVYGVDNKNGLNESYKTFDVRLDKLENWQSNLMGKVTGIATAVGTIVSAMGVAIQHFLFKKG